MKVNQISLSASHWFDALSSISVAPNLFLLFVSPKFPLKTEVLSELHNRFPEALIIGCSTAGEISGITVTDQTIALTAIQFEKTQLKLVSVKFGDTLSSKKTGEELSKKLYNKELKHVFVLSDGLNVNGVDLLAGLKSNLNDVSITGGMAADGEDFNKTFVIKNNEILEDTVVALGLYGESINVGFGSEGGWDSFGIERLVTKSKKNVLYELDGEPALLFYKRLLGKDAANLPSSGLLFPFNLRIGDKGMPIVRGISGINEEDQSLIFGTDIPEGAYMRLMKGNADRLINGARYSAEAATQKLKEGVELAILITCIGRRLVLKQLVEEEVEAVEAVVGEGSKITGFYSYGEIAPFGELSACELHHQTMTITTLREC